MIFLALEEFAAPNQTLANFCSWPSAVSHVLLVNDRFGTLLTLASGKSVTGIRKPTASKTGFWAGKLHDLGGRSAAVHGFMVRLSLGQFKYRVLAADCTVSAPDIQFAINDCE